MISKLLEKYKELSDPAKASLWLIFSSIVLRISSLLTMPIFTRILTPSEYGVFTVFVSDEALIRIICSLNIFADVYTKGLLIYKTNTKELTSSFVGISTLFTAICFAIYYFTKSFTEDILQIPYHLMIFMFIEINFSNYYLLWRTREKYNYRYKRILAISILNAIITPVMGLLGILLMSYRQEAKIFSTYFVEMIIGVIILISFLKDSRNIINYDLWLYGIKSSVVLLPHYLSLFILQQSDRIMISKYNGYDKAALYGIAYTLANTITMVVVAINDTLCPFTYKALRNREYGKVSSVANVIIPVIAGLCAMIALLGPFVIKLFASSEYYEAVWVIPPVAGSVFYMFLFQIFRNISFYYGKNLYIAFASLFGSVLNLVLNYIFIPRFGFISAGYTTLISYAVISIMHFVCSRREMIKQNKRPLYDGKKVLLICLMFNILIVVINISYNYMLLRVMILGALIILGYLYKNVIILNLKELKK